MQFLADNKRDFLLYFNKGFIAASNPASMDKDVFIIKGEGPGEGVYLVDVKKQSTTLEPWAAIMDKYLLHPETLGMTNVDDTVFYLARVPLRHARKGFGDHGNYMTFTPHYDVLREMSRYPSFNIIAHAAYNNHPTPVAEAVEGINRGKYLGRALSRYFGVYVHPDYIDMILLYKNTNIGVVTDKGEIKLAKPHSAYREVLETHLGCKVSIMEK